MRPPSQPKFAPQLKWFCCIFPALILAIIALNSCATLTKKQCRTADWHSLGVNDGVHGRPHSRFEKHMKACKKARVVPNREQWLAGHKEGARRYCRLSNAYEEGRYGRTYHGICEGNRHIAFMRVYRVGLKKYRLERKRDHLSQKISDDESKIYDLESKHSKGKIDKQSAETAIESLDDQIALTRIDLSYAQDELDEFNALLLRDGYLGIARVNLVITDDDEG